MQPSELQFFVGVAFIAAVSFILWGILQVLNIWLKSNFVALLCYILHLFYFWNSVIIGAVIVKQYL